MGYLNEKLEEFNAYLRNRKVAIVGLGVSNLPLLDYLYGKKANVTVFDQKEIDEIPKDIIDKITGYNMEMSFGKDAFSKLVGFEMIFRSPSCLPTMPELEAESIRGAIVTSEIEMLMEMCPAKMIGITGSDGKTTTTSLIYEIIKSAGYNCYLGGNIGTPIFTKIGDMTPDDVVILELSSFQLMGMQVSPDVSVITNITPNHLNIHKDYEEYINAKKAIFRYQEKEGIVVLNYDNEITRDCAKQAKGKVIYFSGKEKLENGYIVDGNVVKECEDKLRRHLLNSSDIHLKGHHNLENICAAIAATRTFVDLDTAINAVKEFTGVEHRLELVREIDGVKWYNDSVSSSPTRTIAGLNSFDEKIVLIAGGYDKNLDYTPIAKPILENVSKLILMGNTSQKILNAVEEEMEVQKKNIDIYMCGNLKQTIEVAHKVTTPEEIVLFSPASASFDMFKNFADRGEQFKKLVNLI